MFAAPPGRVKPISRIARRAVWREAQQEVAE
jgi:hypothetical protein